MTFQDIGPPLAEAVDPGTAAAEPGMIDRLRRRLVTRQKGALRGARDTVELARAILAARRKRAAMIDSDLFGEPAWDLLLELYIATRARAELPVATASSAAGVPISVSLRWIKELEIRGLVARLPSTEGQRREHLQLTAKGLQKMETLLETMLVT